MSQNNPLSNSAAAKDVVLFRIYINDQEVIRSGENGTVSLSGANPIPNPGIRLGGLSIAKVFNKVATAYLTFFDGDPAQRTFALSNADFFKPGNAIKIVMGYQGSMETVFKGLITKHGIKAPEKKASILNIEAKDSAVKLSLNRKNVVHAQKSDADIIRQVAQQNGLRAELDSTTQTHNEIVQYNANDWDFLLMRAEMNGMLVLTDDNVFKCIKPRIDLQNIYEAQYGQNLYEVEAELDARRQIKKATTNTWDYTRQQLNTKAGRASFTEGGNIASSTLANAFNVEEELIHAGFLGQQELEEWANACALKSQLSKISARIKIAGEPKLKPGQSIRIKGVGDRFNGPAYVTGVIHHFHKRWETEVQVGWAEEWFHQQPQIKASPAAGMLPPISGLQIGIVIEEADSNDPDLKIKVALPTMGGLNQGVWARLAMPEAGQNRGMYFRPKRNDEVILGFINNDPRHPIILGSVYSRTNNSAIVSRGTEDKYGYVSEKNQEVIIDDTAKTIHLQTGQCKLVLNGQSNTIELSVGGNKITLKSSGIEVSGTTVTVKGTPIKLN